MATILKLAIKNIYPNYQHYTNIDPSVNIGSSSHRGRVILERNLVLTRAVSLRYDN
jgi:hypothetical protein